MTAEDELEAVDDRGAMHAGYGANSVDDTTARAVNRGERHPA